MRMGHAMIRPVPGSIFSAERLSVAKRPGRLSFAHSDLSGISIFEQAQYHGVSAAQEILRSIGGGK
jgi:hypothetical protein